MIRETKIRSFFNILNDNTSKFHLNILIDIDFIKGIKFTSINRFFYPKF